MPKAENRLFMEKLSRHIKLLVNEFLVLAVSAFSFPKTFREVLPWPISLLLFLI